MYKPSSFSLLQNFGYISLKEGMQRATHTAWGRTQNPPAPQADPPAGSPSPPGGFAGGRTAPASSVPAAVLFHLCSLPQTAIHPALAPQPGGQIQTFSLSLIQQECILSIKHTFMSPWGSNPLLQNTTHNPRRAKVQVQIHRLLRAMRQVPDNWVSIFSS